MSIAIVIEIILLFILPLVLLRLRIVKPEHRFVVFASVFLAIVGIVLYEGWSLRELGFRLDTLQVAIVPYLIFTLLAAVGLVLYARLLGRTPKKHWWRHWHFQLGFLLFGFLQQFIFQGFLVRELQMLNLAPALIVGVVALLFISVHAIYTTFKEGMPLLIVAGIAFALLYLAYQNLIVAIVSHSLLNFLAVLYGFFAEAR